jgi:hypothetical protein
MGRRPSGRERHLRYDGSKLDLDAAQVRVKLWHPMQSEASVVLAWRQRLVKLGVTQPFKQAHREI